MSDSVRLFRLEPARLLCPCDSPGKNTGVGCYSLLQWILSTQGSNPSLLRLQADSLSLSHRGNPAVSQVLPIQFSHKQINLFFYTPAYPVVHSLSLPQSSFGYLGARLQSYFCFTPTFISLFAYLMWNQIPQTVSEMPLGLNWFL